jgi:hypothetical protein
MKITLFILILTVFLSGIVLSQNIRFVDYTSFPDHSKNYDKVGNCVLKKTLTGDILTVELLSQNMQNNRKPEYAFTYRNGILRISTVWPETKGKDTVFYDKVQKKLVNMHTYISNVEMHFDGLGPKAKREVFRLKGFKRIPVRIYLNDNLYPNCPVKDISFRIYKGIVINRINSDGKKDGLWITFYDTGEVFERKQYKNGGFEGGKTFDKKGKDLHYVGEFESGVGSVKFDSIMNK